MFRLLVAFAGIMILVFGTIEVTATVDSAKKTEQKICPVMGGKINPELYYIYKGKKIYVCCPGCIAILKKNSDKYLEKMQKEIEEAKKKDLKKSGK